jgi:hypothetical protein
MRILKSIWEDDEGKYARVDGIKRCWRKANILPVSWECDINNDVGRSHVPISMKTLNKDVEDDRNIIDAEVDDAKDDRNIIDAEVDDAIELLENATLFSDEIYNGALIDDDNEP